MRRFQRHQHILVISSLQRLTDTDTERIPGASYPHHCRSRYDAELVPRPSFPVQRRLPRALLQPTGRGLHSSTFQLDLS